MYVRRVTRANEPESPVVSRSDLARSYPNKSRQALGYSREHKSILLLYKRTQF